MSRPGDRRADVHRLPVRVYLRGHRRRRHRLLRQLSASSPSAARTEMLRALGIDHSAHDRATSGVDLRGAPLRRRLSAPARLDDAARGRHAACSGSAAPRSSCSQQVRRGGEELARLDVRLACVEPRRAGRARLPAALARALWHALANRNEPSEVRWKSHQSRRMRPLWPGPRRRRTCRSSGLFLQADFIVKIVMMHPAGRLVLVAGRSSSRRCCGCAGCARRRAQFEDAFWSGGSLDDLYDRVGNRPDDPMAASSSPRCANGAARAAKGLLATDAAAREPAASASSG